MKTGFSRCLWHLVMGIGILYAITACTQDLVTLEPNDRYTFSLYGWLDVQADTQWVRVMPIGEALIPDDSNLSPAKVTLTRQATGETAVMNDSLFQFGGDAYVWNYRMSDKVYPGELYTLEAESAEGEKSSVVVETPSVIPPPDTWSFSISSESGTVTGFIEDPFVSLKVRYIIQQRDDLGGCFDEEEFFFSYLDETTVKPDGEYYIPIKNEGRLYSKLGNVPYQVNKRELIMITARDSWPDTEDFTPEEMVLPDAVSNVEHGTGYVAAIARRVLVLAPERKPC